MDIKIAICDDESVQRDHLKRLLYNWNHSVIVDSFPSAEAFLFQYNDDKSYDILLLDIEMEEMNGVELAKIIRRDNEFIQIIFITGFGEFISDGYEVSALHYLIKPISETKLYSVLDKAVKNINKTEPTILLTSDGINYRVRLDSIIYVEVFAHTTLILTNDKQYKIYQPITSIESQLPD